jgi:hypothetical protein
MDLGTSDIGPGLAGEYRVDNFNGRCHLALRSRSVGNDRRCSEKNK